MFCNVLSIVYHQFLDFMQNKQSMFRFTCSSTVFRHKPNITIDWFWFSLNFLHNTEMLLREFATVLFSFLSTTILSSRRKYVKSDKLHWQAANRFALKSASVFIVSFNANKQCFKANEQRCFQMQMFCYRLL